MGSSSETAGHSHRNQIAGNLQVLFHDVLLKELLKRLVQFRFDQRRRGRQTLVHIIELPERLQL